MSEKEQGTEHKIKEAARKVFLEKGFAGTKTRDIAEEANINLALLNYYFRSKRKLFEIIMTETLQSFFSGVISIFNDEQTSIKQKVSLFVNHYIDLLTQNQNVAPFIINTVREHPDEYLSKIGLLNDAKNSVFLNQFQDGLKNGEIPPINPLHFLLNLIGLIVTPFIVQPMMSSVTGIPRDRFLEIVQERKKLIPLWVASMLEVK